MLMDAGMRNVREREERIYEVTLVMLWLFQLQQVPQEEYKQHTQVIINVINIDTIKRDRVSLSLSLSLPLSRLFSFQLPLLPVTSEWWKRPAITVYCVSDWPSGLAHREKKKRESL